jgi:hypothetical protein
MARTRLSEILRRYREQEEQAKQEYKQERGLKIARGFEETSDAKRIAKNRQNALYRYRINQLKKTNAPGLTIDDLVSKPDEVTKAYSSSDAVRIRFTLVENYQLRRNGRYRANVKPGE